MNNFFLFIKKFLLTLKTLLKLPLMAKFRRLPKIYLDSTDVVVLGNGPSLNNCLENNFNFLNDKSLISINFFAQSDKYELLRPKFYVLIDPGFFNNETSENLKIQRQNLYRIMKEKTTWELYLFLPFSAQKYKSNYSILFENKNIHIIYFNNVKLEGFKSFIFKFTSIHLGLPKPQNVIVPSLVLAINLGFSKIYLMGADHDWIKNLVVTSENKVCTKLTHFYDNEKMNLQPVILNGKEANMYELLQTIGEMFKSYFIISEYSQKLNKKIINVTPGSFIDAFEREVI